MNYIFEDKMCLEDGLPCNNDNKESEIENVPDDKSQCRNQKYKNLLLPKEYCDLVIKELRS